MSVSITRQEHREHVFYFLQKIPQCRKENQLVYFDHQNVNSLCSCHHYVNSSFQFYVSIELQKHIFKPISAARICFGLFSNFKYLFPFHRQPIFFKIFRLDNCQLISHCQWTTFIFRPSTDKHFSLDSEDDHQLPRRLVSSKQIILNTD